jgi:hypothetical protein
MIHKNFLTRWLTRLTQPLPDSETQLHQQILALLDKPLYPDTRPGRDGKFDIDTLCRLSRHHNGYVREKAVLALALKDDISVLGALINAVNDWVKPIHITAVNAVMARLLPLNFPAFIALLPEIRLLRERQRYDHRAFVEHITGVLAKQARPELQRALNANTRAIRDAALHTLIEHDQLDDEASLLSVLENRDSTLRALAVEYWLERNRALSSSLVAQLLTDPWVRIRRAVLFYLDEHRQLPPEALHHPLLLDKNSLIQQRTRSMLDGRIDAFAFWQQRLDATDATPTQRRAALYGLKEARYPGLLPLAQHAWAQGEPAIRKVALHIFIDLLGDESKPLVLNMLTQPSLPMALTAYHLLSRASFTLMPDDVQHLLDVSPTPDHRAICLRLLRQLNKWDGLILLLRNAGLLTADEVTAERQHWINHYNQAGIPPNARQRETLATLLAGAPQWRAHIARYLP